MRYLISFPSAAMDVSGDELPAVADAAHAVIRDAREAGVYVFGGGLNENVAPVLVAGDGTVTGGGYRELDGGWLVLDVPSREAALHWAARVAAACRCPQEVREFQDDPLA